MQSMFFLAVFRLVWDRPPQTGAQAIPKMVKPVSFAFPNVTIRTKFLWSLCYYLSSTSTLEMFNIGGMQYSACRQCSFEENWDWLPEIEAHALVINQSCLRCGCKITHQARLLRDAKPTLHAMQPAMQYTLRGWLNACCSQFYITAVACHIRTILPHRKKKRKDKTTPFGLSLMRSQVIYHAAQEVPHRLVVLYHSQPPKHGHLIIAHRLLLPT